MQRSMVRLSQTTRSVQPLWRSHVDLSVIGLAGEDAPADLAVGGGEEDLRRLEMEPEVLLRCDGGFCRWSTPVSYTTPMLKQDKRDNVNLSGILIASPIDDVKYITTKC